MLTITGALINGVQTTMYALAAHVYPATIRATGVGTAVSFGRIGAVLSGFIGALAPGRSSTTGRCRSSPPSRSRWPSAGSAWPS
jgi:AAHS family 4-hydroxybenzoate transporter-like MFS transporter